MANADHVYPLLTPRSPSHRTLVPRALVQRLWLGTRRWVAIAAFLLLWEVAPRFGLVEQAFLPPLSEVLSTGVGLIQNGQLWNHVQASLSRSLLGFSLAIVYAVPLGIAIGWYADALFYLLEQEDAPARPRPWAPAFERALARSPLRESPDQIINDWMADELWMMRWLGWDCTFDVARAELATRLAMVRHMVELLRKRRVNSSQAAAEAVMIVELGATFDPWTDLVAMIANDPSPAVRFD